MASSALEIGVGWLKKNDKGEEFISATTPKSNPTYNKQGVTLVAKLDNGEEVEVTNFNMFFNENKKSEKAPDVRFVVFRDQ